MDNYTFRAYSNIRLILRVALDSASEAGETISGEITQRRFLDPRIFRVIGRRNREPGTVRPSTVGQGRRRRARTADVDARILRRVGENPRTGISRTQAAEHEAHATVWQFFTNSCFTCSICTVHKSVWFSTITRILSVVTIPSLAALYF